MTNDTPPEHSPEEIRELRNEHPSGWLILTRDDRTPYLIDAILDTEPNVVFTVDELAERAGTTPEETREKLSLLTDLNIIEVVPYTEPVTYRLNRDSELLTLLHEVNGIVNSQITD